MRLYNAALIATLLVPSSIAFSQGPPNGGGYGGSPGGGGYPGGGSGWTTTLTPNGIVTWDLTSVTPGKSGSGSRPWSFMYGGAISSYIKSIFGPEESSMSVTSSGEFLVQMAWAGSILNRPLTLHVLENVGASYSAVGKYGLPGSGSASNGFSPLVGNTSQGKRLRQFAVPPSGIVNFSSGALSANASASTGPSGNAIFIGQLSAATSYQVSPDTRGVTIFNPDIEVDGQNWGKDENGQRILNLRNSDGSIVVDSAVPYGIVSVSGGGYHPILGNTGWHIYTNYQASTTGFETGLFAPIQTNWTMSGEGSIIESSQLALSQNKQVGQAFITPNPWPKGKTTTVKITVEDKRPSMEATAENTYTVRWHAPWENWHPVGPTKNVRRTIPTRMLSSPVGNGSVQVEWFSEDANIIATTIWEIAALILGGSGDFATAWAGESIPKGVPGSASSLLGYAGKLLEDCTPKPEQGFASVHDMFFYEDSLPSSGRTQAVYDDGRYKLESIDLRIRYALTPHRGDAWTADGYQGEAMNTLAVKIPGTPAFRGTFTIFPQ